MRLLAIMAACVGACVMALIHPSGAVNGWHIVAVLLAAAFVAEVFTLEKRAGESEER